MNNHSEQSIFCPTSVNKKLDEVVSEFGLPEWIFKDKNGQERKCSICQGNICPTSVRGINLCLNAQHIGDIQIEILCRVCSSSYFLHFRKECKNVLEFSSHILGKTPNSDPVMMTEIDPSENNIAEAIVEDVKNKQEDKICQS